MKLQMKLKIFDRQELRYNSLFLHSYLCRMLLGKTDNLYNLIDYNNQLTISVR